ncbi:MAG: hypothetical protein ACR2K0_03930, partial [Acidimicrobiales bacterium]
MPPGDDPVRQRRAFAARLASRGKRLGFTLFLVATGVLVVGLTTTFSDAVSRIVIACLVLGSLVLAPAIILGYATKAAERQDR